MAVFTMKNTSLDYNLGLFCFFNFSSMIDVLDDDGHSLTGNSCIYHENYNFGLQFWIIFFINFSSLIDILDNDGHSLTDNGCVHHENYNFSLQFGIILFFQLFFIDRYIR